jgi:hypothetical protein
VGAGGGRPPGYDYLVAGNDGDVGAATVLLYLVVSLTVQRYALLRRFAREEAGSGSGRLSAPAGRSGPEPG